MDAKEMRSYFLLPLSVEPERKQSRQLESPRLDPTLVQPEPPS